MVMSKIEDLEKLQQLKESGALTDVEYEMEKNKILNSNEEKKESLNNTNKKSTKALTGFILGLSSLIAWLIPIIGYPVSILGIIFSSLGLNSSRKGMAITGLILSIIFFIVTLINSIAGAMIMSQNYTGIY